VCATVARCGHLVGALRYGAAVSSVTSGLSKRRVDRAGIRFREWLTSEEPPYAEFSDDVRVLLVFRAGFQGPLNKVTMGLRSFVEREMKTIPPDGKLPVGQRLKREPQVILKLHRHPKMALSRMQDIGGCRAIPTGGAPEVAGILRRIRKNWVIKGFKDYVADPAPSGYRAIHVIVLRDAHLVEIQLRTPRQHEWAEAVERTGLRTRHALKDGSGPEDLLRYFRLAADGIAAAESGDPVDQEFIDEFTTAREAVAHYFTQ
jgi:putative GTP pyrophosphokinase